MPAFGRGNCAPKKSRYMCILNAYFQWDLIKIEIEAVQSVPKRNSCGH